MQKKSYAVLMVAVFTGLLFSCTRTNEQSANNKTISINIQNAKPLKEAVTSMSVLNFPDSTDIFFGEILSMEITNDTIYIFDRFSSQGIYAYDKTGKLLYSYTAKGGGPEEFIGLADFSIHGDEIALLDCHGGKIVFIDKQGNFIRQSPSESNAQNLAVTNDGIWYDFSNIASANKDKLVHVSTNGEKTSVLPIPDDVKNLVFLAPHALTKANSDSLYYLPCMEPRIYLCHDAKAEELYSLDFNGAWPIWENYSKSLHPGAILQSVVDNGLVHQLKLIADNNLICITFHCKENVYVDIIDTDTDSSTLYYMTPDDIEKVGEPVYIYNGQLVFGSQDSLIFMTLK